MEHIKPCSSLNTQYVKSCNYTYILYAIKNKVIEKILDSNSDGFNVKFWILYKEELCELYRSANEQWLGLLKLEH
jgi:hypothetical protein